MHRLIKLALYGFFTAMASAAAEPSVGKFNVNAFKIDLSSKVDRMKERIENTKLPARPEYSGASGVGIEIEYLRTLKQKWVENWDWALEQKLFNR